MSTKAYYPISEIGAGKVGFSKTRSIIEAAFYGNNVVKVNTLKQAYELAKNSPGTIVTDMPVKDGETFGLEKDAKVLLFNDGAVTGRYVGRGGGGALICLWGTTGDLELGMVAP